jgi:hypothetical protein
MLGFYRTYTTPFKEKIPSFEDGFFLRVSAFKRFLRFFSRYIYTEISLRNSKKIEKISPQHKRILWIQWVDAYLGDSLMDLSSRVLLADKRVDLLTKKYTANIYKDDDVFDRIFTNSSQCNPDDYDLLIIDSYRERSIRSFIGILSHIPHVSLYGYYNVDDFNRLYFSFYRINQLLLYPHNKQYIDDIARPLLPITSLDKSIVEGFGLTGSFITVVVGGAWKERTFHYWADVIKGILSKNIVEKVVLVGASDAKEESVSICKQYPNNVVSFVGGCTFNQTAQVINKSIMLICADGGLMHAANAVKTPILGLFHELDPSVRFIKSNRSFGLTDKWCIDNISIKEIVRKAEILSLFDD